MSAGICSHLSTYGSQLNTALLCSDTSQLPRSCTLLWVPRLCFVVLLAVVHLCFVVTPCCGYVAGCRCLAELCFVVPPRGCRSNFNRSCRASFPAAAAGTGRRLKLWRENENPFQTSTQRPLLRWHLPEVAASVLTLFGEQTFQTAVPPLS